MKYTYLTLFLFLSLNAFALDFNDKLQANILDIYSGSYLRVSRGLEDGIDRGDVARFLTKSKQIGRGICTIVEKNYSVWFIYKNYGRFNQIEPTMMYYKGNTVVPLKHRLLVESDLQIVKTSRKKKTASQIRDTDPRRYYLSEHYGSVKHKNDIESYYFDRHGVKVMAEVAPLVMATDSSESNYSFGAEIERTGDHNFYLEADSSSHKSVNEYTGEENRTTRTNARGEYFITDFFNKGNSYFAFAQYDNKKEQDFSPVAHHIVASPFGVLHKLNFKNSRFKNSFISYSPAFDYLKRDVQINESSNEVLTESEGTFRHAFMFNTHIRLYENKIWLEENFQFMPKQETSGFAIDFSDLNLSNKLRFVVKLGKYFSVNYINEVLYNNRLDITGEKNEFALRQMLTVSFDATI